MPRYAANERASVKVMLAPWEALAMAVKMNRFVGAEVERARQVRTVKGLKRKLLWELVYSGYGFMGGAYPAAIAVRLHLSSFLDDENSLETAALPLCAT
jgi:hypothetical protein